MSLTSSEYLLSTCSSTNEFSISLKDFETQAGNNIKFYKNGGTVQRKCLDLIGNDFIVTAEIRKPLLHIWQVNNQEPVKNIGLVLPDVANVLAVSPDNCYLAVGIGSKLFTWQICSGLLLSVQRQHLLTITCLEFSSDGDFLISGSLNGSVITYNFGDLICVNQVTQSELGQVTPLYVKNDSVGSIADIKCGSFGFKSRFVTVTNDHTANVYELLTGTLLLKVVFNELPTSVAMDSPCWNLYFGFNSGVIRKMSLMNPPRNIDVHFDGVEEKADFVGHTKKVNCLELNISNQLIVSGSDDCFVFIWNADNRDLLNRIEHKSPVTNIKLWLKSESLFAQNLKPNFVIKTLQRNVITDLSDVLVSVIQNDTLVWDEEVEEKEQFKSADSKKIAELEEINKQLYNTLIALSSQNKE